MAEEIKIKIQDNEMDYAVNITTCCNTKLYFLKTLLEETKAIEVQPTETMEKDKACELSDKFKTVFRHRGKDIDFTNLKDINKILSKIYKELFKDYITISRKGKAREYHFEINKEQEEFHKKVFNYSVGNIINVEPIEDDEPSTDYIEELCIY